MFRSQHLFKAVVTAVALFPSIAFAQLVGTENFLQGNYVEVGVATNGSFGSGTDAPTGYHPRGVGNLLGFVADPDKDGWAAGTPNYIGDYFLPGSPQEGWDIQFDGTWAKAWRGGGATSFSGGLTGSCTTYSSTGGIVTGTWQGTVGTLKIRQQTTLRKDRLYFITKVTIKNTGTADVNNIYYERTVDPDNEVAVPGGGSFTTINRLEYRLPNKEHRTLVSGTGQTFGAYLGLGTKDCRAKPYIVKSSLEPSDSLSKMFNDNAKESETAIFRFEDPDTAYIQDVGIGVMFNVGTLKPGDSTNLSYAYVLSVADLDSAFADISPVWEYDGKRYEAGDTVKICRDKGAPDEHKNLDIVGGSGYTWTWTPSPGLENLTGTDNSIILTDATKTYTAKPSEAFGCITNMTITIQPFTNPDPPAVISPVTYCRYGSAVPLVATGMSGARFLFYTTATGGTGVSTLTPNTNVPGTYMFYASQVNGICESGRTPITVVVNPLPTIDSVTGSDPTYCGGKDGYIRFKTEAGKTYKVYYDKDLTGQPTLTLTSDANGWITIPGLGKGKYTAIYVENEFGCRSVTYYGILDLRGPVGVTPIITNNGPVCVGDVVKLTATHHDSTSYIWTGPGGYSSGAENPTFIATDASGGTYSLVTDKKACITDPVLTDLVVNPLPKATNVPDQAACEGDALLVDLTVAEPLITYTWTGPGGYSSPVQTINISSIQLSQAGQYVLTALTEQGCMLKDTIQVNVDEPVMLSFSSDTTICSGDSAQLVATTNTTHVQWTPSTGLNNAAIATPKASPTAATTYTVTAKSDHSTCPDKSGQVTVSIKAAPQVQGYDTLVRMNVPYTIMPVYGQDAIRWHWVPSDSLSCDDCPNPVFNSRQDKTYMVYVSNGLGCTSSDTVTIRVFCDGASVTMPNAFTPNNDGHNDLYYVRGHGFSVKQFVIYNRLGQEVFHKENFEPNDKNYGWDGTFNGAQITEAAGFVYMLEVQCYNSGYATTIMKGTILLIR